MVRRLVFPRVPRRRWRERRRRPRRRVPTKSAVRRRARRRSTLGQARAQARSSGRGAATAARHVAARAQLGGGRATIKGKGGPVAGGGGFIEGAVGRLNRRREAGGARDSRGGGGDGGGGEEYRPNPSLFRDDGLHLSPAGYQIWNNWVGDALRALGVFTSPGRGAVYLFVEINVRPGKKAAFLEKLTAHGKNVRAEDGCLWLDILTDKQSKDKVLVWEGWGSRAAWDVHMGNVASAAWGRVASAFVFGEKITVMDLHAKM